MVEKLTVVKAEGLYPYRNQAIESFLLDSCGKDEMILYLWANEKTVFIGKNQNAYTECRLALLKKDGGYLARRFTGGGAVYHDGGNLNFSFLAHRENYDLSNQFSILEDALLGLGLKVERNGRNDVTIDGKKFSGNAFYQSEKNCLHHGTILIRSDCEAIAKYLNVSRVKLAAKGVKSVLSRVGNLSDFMPGISAGTVGLALEEALKRRYPKAAFSHLAEGELDAAALKAREEAFSDEKYLLGDNVQYGLSAEARFSWGVADVRLDLEGTVVRRARIYSDCLEPALVAEKEALLRGADFSKPCDPRIQDIIEVFGEQL